MMVMAAVDTSDHSAGRVSVFESAVVDLALDRQQIINP